MGRQDSGKDRSSARLQELLRDLESRDETTRAQAVREMCPCRSAWDVPVQRYVSALREDPSSSVRHEAQHVLEEDSKLGKRLEMRRAHRETREVVWDPAAPGPYSLAWRKGPKPLNRDRCRVPPLRLRRLGLRRPAE